MRITQSPIDALLAHIELQRETPIESILGLEWLKHLDETLIKINREENKSIGFIQPIMPLSFLNHNIGLILQS